MIKISVCGGLGRMGKRVSHQIEENPQTELSGIIDCIEQEGVCNISEGVDCADVVIDFSTPSATIELLKVCLEKEKKVVIGTTGFDAHQKEEIIKASKKIPVLLSPNMSVGVNLIFKIVNEINKGLKGYDKEIIEAHHNKKVDAPSGTALKIAEIISADDNFVYGREGKVGTRKKNEVGIHAVRGGNIIGEHTVMWIGPYDRVELTHRAESRDVFASGAVRAAIWLNDQKSGRLYTIKDVLES